MLLQWGQRKRSRISRAEIRSSSTTTTPADDSSSSSGQGKTQSNKLSRRSLNPSMPPPAPVFSARSSNNRNGIVGGKEIFLSRFSPNLHTPMHFPIFIFIFYFKCKYCFDLSFFFFLKICYFKTLLILLLEMLFSLIVTCPNVSFCSSMFMS